MSDCKHINSSGKDVRVLLNHKGAVYKSCPLCGNKEFYCTGKIEPKKIIFGFKGE